MPIGNAKLFGGLLHDPGQWSIMGVAHERAKMVDDVMVESARKPANHGVFGRIIGRRREDVIDAVLKLIPVRRKVGAVDGMCRLEHKRCG